MIKLLDMNKLSIKLFSIILLFTTSIISCSSAKQDETKTVRKPAVSGAFYPSGKTALQSIVNECLNNSTEYPAAGGTPAILIVPHAGYVYSAQVAAYAFKTLTGKQYNTVILLGPSHHVYLTGAAIYDSGAWETPLGTVEVDSKIADDILKTNEQLFNPDKTAFAEEHSQEVELPFLQTVLKGFRIVPILLNNTSEDFCRELAFAIIKAVTGKNILIVCSSDMSHYFTYDRAVIMDKLVSDDIEKLDIDSLRLHLEKREGELCGSAAVLTALTIAKEKRFNNIKLLKYANSGDVTGDKTKVVGYGAFVILKNKGTSSGEPASGGKSALIQPKLSKKSKEALKGENMLDIKQQDTLIKIARETLESFIRTGKIPDFNVPDPLLKEKRGVFVTLNSNGRLRGCIGYIMPVEELYKAVSRMAIQSATEDPRFSPVRADELNDIDIEISVLSVPTKVAGADEIQLGKHGVIVKRGFRQGVFLPQVATETGWTKEEFLNRLCADKAGLPANAWKDKTTELSVFSAQVIEEKK